MRRKRTRPRIAASSKEGRKPRKERKPLGPIARYWAERRAAEGASEASQGRSGAGGKKRRRKGAKGSETKVKPSRLRRVTVYPTRFAVDEPTAWDLSWRELVRLCTDPDEREVIEAGEKDSLRIWHGARLKEGGGRRNADVESVSCLFLDVDKGGLRRAIAELKKRGIRAVAFASPSGRTGRGRILVDITRDLSPAEYRLVWTIVNSWLGDVVDKQTRSPSHGFYTPAIVRGRKFWSREVKGKPLDVDELDLTIESDVAPVMRAPRAEELEELDLPWRRARVMEHIRELPETVEEGDRHGTLLRLAQKCLDFALPEKATREIVLNFNAERCDPPKEEHIVDSAVLANPEKYRRHPVGCEVAVCVKIVSDYSVVLKRIVEILAERCENLYVRGGKLIELIFDEKGNEKYSEIGANRFATLISQHVRLYKFFPGNKEEPPGWVKTQVSGKDRIPQELMAMPVYPGVRPLDGVASAATLREDGSVLCEPGYDSKTRLYFSGEPLELSHKPTREEGVQAMKRVQRIFRQFPINALARSAHLSMLLSAVARPYIQGPCPVLLVDANQKQSGKSLLAQSVSIVMTGRMGTRVDWVQKDELMPEKLHACMCTDPRILFFDNVRNGITLKSETLDGAMTAMNITRRGHYSHQNMDMPFKPLVLITGNGFSVGGDMGPRSMYIRVETKLEHPEERDDLEIKNLIEHLKEHRTEIIKDLITMWRAWIAAGEPGEVVPWHTVTGWEKVRKMLVWYGRKDPKLASKSSKVDDEEAIVKAGIVKLILEKWPPRRSKRGRPQAGGAPAGQIIATLEPRKVGGLSVRKQSEGHSDLYYKIEGLLPKDEKLNPASFGRVLKRFHKSVVGEWQLWRVNRSGIAYWTVRHVDDQKS